MGNATWAYQLKAIPKARLSACCIAFHPRAMEIGPNPGGFDGRWWNLNAHGFRLCRLREMGKSYAFNRDKLDSKASWLQLAVYLTAAEVLCLILALSL